MEKIGFAVSDLEIEDVEVGSAEVGLVEQEAHWASGLPEYFFETWLKFCIVYGTFSAVKDLLVLSFF
jgi:hypothetical protein